MPVGPGELALLQRVAANKAKNKNLYREGPEGLKDILDEYLPGEIKYAQEQRGRYQPQFESFLNEDTIGFSTDLANRLSESYAQDLFQAGGPIYSAISQARGDTISRGFAPEGATGKVDSILRQAAESIGRFGIQQALPVAGDLRARQYALAGSQFGADQNQVAQLISSLFTGYAGAESLRLGEQDRKKGFIGKALDFIF